MTGLARLALDRGVQRLLDGLHGGGPSNSGNPGGAVGVVQDGALTVHRCAGLASLELGVPIGPDTAFRVASVTKQFTCAAVLMLAEEGRLRLEDEAHGSQSRTCCTTPAASATCSASCAWAGPTSASRCAQTS